MSDRLRVSKHRRIKIENAIEKLIDMLDRSEPNPDLEPSLGSSGWHGWSSGADQTLWASGNKDDREDEHDGCEPPEDDEPSLGATHSINQKLAWVGGRGWNMGDDLEFDGQTAQSADDEPSLGARSCGNQLHWAQGNRDDRELDDKRELDPAEDGIGDGHGATEQYSGAGTYEGVCHAVFPSIDGPTKRNGGAIND